jgi:hypothetical protein
MGGIKLRTEKNQLTDKTTDQSCQNKLLKNTFKEYYIFNFDKFTGDVEVLYSTLSTHREIT